MKAWIAAQMLGALKLLGAWAVEFWCTDERALKNRERDRQMWWNFKSRAAATENKEDDRIARYIQIRFNFHDSPDAKANERMLAKLGLPGHALGGEGGQAPPNA